MMNPKRLLSLLGEIYQHGENGNVLHAAEIKDQIMAAAKRPVVGVSVAVFHPDAGLSSGWRVLLEKRGPKVGNGAGTWSLPGGWLEYGETFVQAALRELTEETTLTAKSGLLWSTIEPGLHSDGIHCITGLVLARGWSGTPMVTDPTKCEALEWHDMCNLPEPLFTPLRAVAQRMHVLRGELNYLLSANPLDPLAFSQSKEPCL